MHAAAEKILPFDLEIEETMLSQLADTSRAFDSVANEYDGPLGNNALVQRMRKRVIARITSVFPRGARLLDLGCGTGMDAVDLAARGYEIVAIDSSRRMVERTQARIAQAQVENLVRAVQIGIHELGRLHEGPFDGFYSNFGPLNCVPDLRAASQEMARLCKPRGKIIASVIGKYCPWEFTFFVLRGDLKRARARFSRGIVAVPLYERKVWTHFHTPREFYRSFVHEFELTALRTLGLFLPPPYLVHAYQRYKNLFAPFAFLDDRLGGVPFLRNFGDHFLIELQKRK